MQLEIKYILKLESEKFLNEESLKILLDNSYFHYLKMVRTNQKIKSKNIDDSEEINKLNLINKIIELSKWDIESKIKNEVFIKFVTEIENKDFIYFSNNENTIMNFFNENFIEFSKDSHLNDRDIWESKLLKENIEIARKNIRFIIDFHLSSSIILKDLKIENIKITRD